MGSNALPVFCHKWFPRDIYIEAHAFYTCSFCSQLALTSMRLFMQYYSASWCRNTMLAKVPCIASKLLHILCYLCSIHPLLYIYNCMLASFRSRAIYIYIAQTYLIALHTTLVECSNSFASICINAMPFNLYMYISICIYIPVQHACMPADHS